MTTVAVGTWWRKSEGEGPPVVMMHGLGGTVQHVSSRSWRRWLAFASSAPTCRAPAARRRRAQPITVDCWR